MNLNEAPGLQGHVSIYARLPSGKTLWLYGPGPEENWVFNQSRAAWLKALDWSQDFVPDPPRYLLLGSGGTYTVGAADVKPVEDAFATDALYLPESFDPGACALYTPYDPGFNGVTFGNYDPHLPAPTFENNGRTLVYTYQLPDTYFDPVNNRWINEAAMATQSGKIFSMKTFPSLQKPTGLTLYIRWSITVS